MKKDKVLKVLSLLSVVIALVSVSGCSEVNKTKDSFNAEEKAGEVAYAFNLKYKTELMDTDRLAKSFDEETVYMIENTVDSIKTANESTDFINLEEYFQIYGNNIVEEEDEFGNIITYNLVDNTNVDSNIVEVDGKRGVHLSDAYVKDNGKFDVNIYGNYIEVEVPENKLMAMESGYYDNYMQVKSYNLYDNGKFKVVLESDIDGAYENFNINIVANEEDITENLGDVGVALDLLAKGETVNLTQEMADIVYEEMLNGRRKVSVIDCEMIDNKISGISYEEYIH